MLLDVEHRMVMASPSRIATIAAAVEGGVLVSSGLQLELLEADGSALER